MSCPGIVHEVMNHKTSFVILSFKIHAPHSVATLQRSLRYCVKRYWQALLRDGVYVYTPENHVKGLGFQSFRERCGEPSLWKATMLWNESHPDEFIRASKRWENGDHLYIGLLILMTQLYNEGLLEGSVVWQLAPEVLNALTGYFRLRPQLRAYNAGEDVYDLFDSMAVLKTKFPAKEGDHPKLDIQGAVAACKEVVYERVLVGLHRAPGRKMVWVMRSANSLEVDTDKLAAEVDACLTHVSFVRFGRQARSFLSVLAQTGVPLSEAARRNLEALVVMHFQRRDVGLPPDDVAYVPLLEVYAAVVPKVSAACVDEALDFESRIASAIIDWETQWEGVIKELGLGAGSKEEAVEVVGGWLTGFKGLGDVEGAVNAIRRVMDVAMRHRKPREEKVKEEKALAAS
jgi:hypothetical protein